MECNFSDYTPLITAFSALLGVISGGLITYLSSAKIKKIEISGKMTSDTINERKSIYTDFLCSVNESATKTIQNKKIDFDVIYILSNHLAKIEILANGDTYEASKKLVDSVLKLDKEATENSERLPERRKEFVRSVRAELKNIT